jgi:hypothetical protein
MNAPLVLGELGSDIASELSGFTVEYEGDRARLEGRFPEAGALMRAWFRAEAELLLADATDMADRRYRERTPDQRRYDAFLMLVERFTESAGSSRYPGSLPSS